MREDAIEELLALAKRWGRRAEQVVREPTFGKEARGVNDGTVTTLRRCEKELIDLVADIRRGVRAPHQEEA